MSIFTNKLPDNQSSQAANINDYYKFHAKIYDLTRWTFLFGRKALIEALPFEESESFKLCEVGCGTGYNLEVLARKYPHLNAVGIDVSKEMLQKSHEKLKAYDKNITFIHAPYSEKLNLKGVFDVILFSYSLTMINPQWEELIDQAYKDLKPGGFIAVVDFHYSKQAWFKSWMEKNHVRMDAHLLPALIERFDFVTERIKFAYAGLWEYFWFVGKKPK